MLKVITIANIDDNKPNPKVVDAVHFVPQHRERVILVGVDMRIADTVGAIEGLDLQGLSNLYPEKRPTLIDILDKNSDVDKKYTLSPKLWKYLQDYAAKHKAKGNGFGYHLRI